MIFRRPKALTNAIMMHHIPKCAGTSLLRYFETHFLEEERITRCSTATEAAESLDRLDSSSSSQRRKLKLVHGHRVFELKSRFQPKAEACFFRHPLSRAISHYHFHNQAFDPGQTVPSVKGPIIHQIRKPLEELGERKFLYSLLEMIEERGGYSATGIANPNYMAMTLGLFMGFDPKSIDQDQIDKCVEKLSFIGITEHAEISIFLMHKIFKTPLGTLTRENFQNYFSTKYFSKWFMDEIESHMNLDFYLYKSACKRFDNQWAEIKESESQLQSLKSYLLQS
jgi:hypothetical protein